MPRILFLTSGKDVPSSRFRVLPYLPLLQRDGWDCVVRPCEPDKYTWSRRRGLFGKLANFRLLVKKIRSRKRAMRDAASFDVVYIERELMPKFSPTLEQRVATRNRHIVFDFDDAIFLRYGKAEPNPVASIVKLARSVIAGNEWLMTWAAPHNVNTHLIPTPIDTDRWTPAEHPERKPDGSEPPVVVCWTGSSGNLASLKTISTPLKRAKERFPRLVLRVVSNEPPAEDPCPPMQFVPWSEDSEVQAVRTADFGVMPLPDDEWSKGKCGFKLLQYMACGLPGIASPVGVNGAILQEDCGFLARTAEEWEETIVRMCEARDARLAMGTRARKRAEEVFSVKALYPHWKKAIESAQG